MSSQWDNFLLNRGEWRGSFTNLSTAGLELDSSASILILEPAEEDRLVRFHLRRFGHGGYDSEPTREVRTDYRTLGRQVVFFDSGCFSKGSLQLAPNTSSGAEFGFIDNNRRFRLVQLFDDAGVFDGLVLIREFRADSEAQERPPLQPDHLCGLWRGQVSTITADWPVADIGTAEIRIEQSSGHGFNQLRIQTTCGVDVSTIVGQINSNHLQIDADLPSRMQFLPDGGYSLVPLQVSHRIPFVVEAGWMPAPNRLERLIRRYDASGAWVSSSQISATAC